jgi:hypothetical protein
MPPPRGKQGCTNTYEDANLMFCLVTGRSMTGIIHMTNKAPVQALLKLQHMVLSS